MRESPWRRWHLPEFALWALVWLAIVVGALMFAEAFAAEPTDGLADVTVTMSVWRASAQPGRIEFYDEMRGVPVLECLAAAREVNFDMSNPFMVFCSPAPPPAVP